MSNASWALIIGVLAAGCLEPRAQQIDCTGEPTCSLPRLYHGLSVNITNQLEQTVDMTYRFSDAHGLQHTQDISIGPLVTSYHLQTVNVTKEEYTLNVTARTATVTWSAEKAFTGDASVRITLTANGVVLG